MAEARLEHANITVSNLDETATRLCQLFDWRIRWQGNAIDGGRSIHVGGDGSYLALYGPATEPTSSKRTSYATTGGLNHVGILVDDLDDAERRVIDAGYQPHSHANYEPGRRFYFRDEDQIEFEVICYD